MFKQEENTQYDKLKWKDNFETVKIKHLFLCRIEYLYGLKDKLTKYNTCKKQNKQTKKTYVCIFLS